MKISEQIRQAAPAAKDVEQKALSLLKLDLKRAMENASDLWTATKPNHPSRKSRMKIYEALKKIKTVVDREKPTL